MTTKAIKKEILKNDGVILRETETRIFGMCRGYDIEFIGGSVLTMRRTKNRATYDAGSDYNPGGYMFLRRIKDISYYLQNN